MGNNKSIFTKKLKRATSNSPKDYHNNLNEFGPQSLDDNRELGYYLSNDDYNVSRQHNNYFFRRYLFRSKFSAPMHEKLVQGCKVLDSGCGAGTWLLDMANQYENSKFFGVDIKPLYPNEIKPENLEFSKADIFEGLPFPDNEFDFTHQETMSFIIKANQWNYVISELIRVTKPGGFIEILEYMSPRNNGPIMTKVYQKNIDLALQRGVDMDLLPQLGTIFESHQHITKAHKVERNFVIGPNGGKAGIAILDDMITFHTSDVAVDELRTKHGMTKKEYINMFRNDLNKELEKTRPELTVCRFWAQKET